MNVRLTIRRSAVPERLKSAMEVSRLRSRAVGVEEIREILQLAVIEESDLTGLTQVLHYPTINNESTENIKLMELDGHLHETLNNGGSLTFQGKGHGAALLCTKSQTYEINETEVSNSSLLVPHLKFAEDTKGDVADERSLERQNVKGIFYKYFEVRRRKPDFSKLIGMLEPTAFKGKEYESSLEAEDLYTWDKLRDEIQSSEDELKQALSDYMIVEIGGYYRLISFEAEAKSVTHMLDFFESNSWESDRVDREMTYEALKELIIEPVFDLLFEKYTERGTKTKENGQPLYRYNEGKTCKILAKVLLSSCSVNEYSVFMNSWNIATPEQMTPKEEYLGGVGLVVWNGKDMRKEVVSFPEENLPTALHERFKKLFKMKRKWTVQEITPYISSLTTSAMNVNALLTKYTRCVTVDGVKYYSAKYGK